MTPIPTIQVPTAMQRTAPDDRAMSPRERGRWRAAQAVLLAIVGVIVALLFVRPPVGLTLLWDVLVPATPLVVLLAPGVWRNLCPLATVALLPHRLGRSRRAHPRPGSQGGFALTGVAALLLILPLRHIAFNHSGVASGLLLLALATAAMVTGWLFANKSGWCAGFCPVHPVERLYGTAPVIQARNAHCATCVGCAAPCPDSSPGPDPSRGNGQGWPRRWVGVAMIGGFPGFVFGWFMTPDMPWAIGWRQLNLVYGLPLLGALISGTAFVGLRQVLPRRTRRLQRRCFAAGALATYYGFRLPALLGWPQFAGDGVLLDVSASLPDWTLIALRVATVAAVCWLLVIRRSRPRPWLVRPPAEPQRP